jgi:hypothetical protein
MTDIIDSLSKNLVDKKEESVQTITCETTSRSYSGCIVMWRSESFEQLKTPLPGTNLKRGFCYKK